MEEHKGTVERIDFDPSSRLRPLVVVLKSGRTLKLLQPIMTSSDLESHEAIMRITQPGDMVRIGITSADHLSLFQNASLEGVLR